MMENTAAVLGSANDNNIVLESVDIDATLKGVYAEVDVTQVYRNQEQHNIEAVYTFPLPLDAVLLSLSLELNDKVLRGVVQSKSTAADKYEDAISDGDSAVLLEQIEPGLYTLNVGNIQPSEKAVIRLKYGQLHKWQGDSLRFYMPVSYTHMTLPTICSV